MTEFGYALSSEEHPPNDLVANARKAEDAGFSFALISDHYHPWVDAQGHNPFVWSVLGGIAHATEKLRIGTGVTCPTMRIHPAIIAQAAATSAAMLPGRFFLGVGTGENLNEHVLGDHWPAPDQRLEMLEEAVEVIRLLWQGGYQTHRGKHYTVENARLYTLPDEPTPIAVAASKPQAAELAGRVGDAFVGVTPEQELLDKYAAAGGSGPRYGHITLCWAESEEEAAKTAYEVWPNAATEGGLSADLALPKDFEAVAEMIRQEDVAEKLTIGPDPQVYLDAVKEYEDAGYDHIYFHQVGRDQDGFFRFWEQELKPKLS